MELVKKTKGYIVRVDGKEIQADIKKEIKQRSCLLSILFNIRTYERGN